MPAASIGPGASARTRPGSPNGSCTRRAASCRSGAARISWSRIEGAGPRAALLPRESVAAVAGEAILLGLSAETAYFAIDLSAYDAPLEAIGDAAAMAFTDLRRVGPLLPRQEGALLAYARGIAYWHSRHRFCGVCGAPTRSEEGGHVRRCTNPACKARAFPAHRSRGDHAGA